MNQNTIDVHKKAQLIARCTYATEVAEGYTLCELTVYQLSGQVAALHKYPLLTRAEIETYAKVLYSEYNLV